jgi:lipoprotein Spr
MKQYLLALGLMILAFQLPVQAQQQEESAGEAANEVQPSQKDIFERIFGFSLPEAFNPVWYETIYHWLGTPYRYAGRSLHGIDCSNFVNAIYQSIYGFIAGTNSVDQYTRSQRVSRDELQEGDLVFFKINGKRISHVGIYLGNNRFVHSSRSRGVIISDLTHPYFQKRYAGAGRFHF